MQMVRRLIVRRLIQLLRMSGNIFVVLLAIFCFLVVVGCLCAYGVVIYDHIQATGLKNNLVQVGMLFTITMLFICSIIP